MRPTHFFVLASVAAALSFGCASDPEGATASTGTTDSAPSNAVERYANSAGVYGDGFTTTTARLPGSVGGSGGLHGRAGSPPVAAGRGAGTGTAGVPPGKAGAPGAGQPGAGAPGFTWTDSYDSQGTAADPTGRHNPGMACLNSACHAAAQTKRAFAFAGTVYQADGTTPAPNVEVAIPWGASTVTTYTASNGNFWVTLASAATIDWANASAHLRNANAGVAKPDGTSVDADCNNCHKAGQRILGP